VAVSFGVDSCRFAPGLLEEEEGAVLPLERVREEERKRQEKKRSSCLSKRSSCPRQIAPLIQVPHPGGAHVSVHDNWRREASWLKQDHQERGGHCSTGLRPSSYAFHWGIICFPWTLQRALDVKGCELLSHRISDCDKACHGR